ncbi:MAG: tyrosine-type recombinase/integrase [Eggerthellaceae bacterium]|nr:tyrosine-type recombinase/integrase [Eggerthellaceae bacterium]
MKRYEHTSALAPDIDAFLDYMRRCGKESSTRYWMMHDFDRYCERVGAAALTREVVDGWIRERLERTSPDSRSWISCIRVFGRWSRLNSDPGAYVLPARSYRTANSRNVPYLLSEGDVDAFFGAIDGTPLRGPWRWQTACFFALMSSCGLRTCEVRKLGVSDVDFGAMRIHVRWSKGNRSRVLAVTEDVRDVLAECSARTDCAFGDGRRAFFVGTGGGPVGASRPGALFRRIWAQAGLPWPDSGPEPRPYAFRHRFAYANIERWAAEGRDVEAMLPYLAKYMGHSCFESTYYYVHTSPDFMAGFADATRSTDPLLPEVGFDG